MKRNLCRALILVVTPIALGGCAATTTETANETIATFALDFFRQLLAAALT